MQTTDNGQVGRTVTNHGLDVSSLVSQHKVDDGFLDAEQVILPHLISETGNQFVLVVT